MDQCNLIHLGIGHVCGAFQRPLKRIFEPTGAEQDTILHIPAELLVFLHKIQCLKWMFAFGFVAFRL